MMLPTHVLAGLALALPLVALAPEWAPVVLAGSIAGSVLPDLDLYAGHRRTLHYPTGYLVAAVPLVAAAVALRYPVLVGAAFLALGAALHCRMDRYGGGLELRPWEGRSERAVYDHVRGEWRKPKRWVRYDGSPEDLALAGVLAFPALTLLDGPVRTVVTAALVVAIAYATLRRRLADLAPALVSASPAAVAGYLPARYRDW